MIRAVFEHCTDGKRAGGELMIELERELQRLLEKYPDPRKGGRESKSSI